MSTATPTERATAAQRLDFYLTDLELAVEKAQREGYEFPVAVTTFVETLRERVDQAIEVLTRV